MINLDTINSINTELEDLNTYLVSRKLTPFEIKVLLNTFVSQMNVSVTFDESVENFITNEKVRLGVK